MSVLGFVEFQRASDRFEHAVRDAVQFAALDAGVVRDTHTGEDGDLLAAKAGNAARSKGGKARLLVGDPRSAGGEELSDLAACVHLTNRLEAAGWAWGTLSVPLSTGTLTSRDRVLSWVARSELPNRKAA